MKFTAEKGDKFITIWVILLFATMASFSLKIMVGMVSLFEEMAVPDVLEKGTLLFYLFFLVFLICNHKFDKSFLGIGTCQFLICFTILDLFASLYGPIGITDYLYRVFPLVLSMFTYLAGYNLYLRCPSNSKWIMYSTIAISIILCVGYIIISNGIRFTFEHSSLRLGIAYLPLIFSPLLLLNKNRLSYFSFLLIGYVILDSGKRGGMLALIIGLVCFYFIIKGTLSASKKIRIAFVTVCAILLLVSFFSESTIASDMIERLIHGSEDSDYTSGRVSIYEEVLKRYSLSDPINMLIGHGYGSVDKISQEGLSAHNDFIEALYDFGIIGCMSYFVFYYYFIKQIMRASQRDVFYKAVLIYAFIVFLFLSFFSQIFIYQYLCLFTFVLGAISGAYKQRIITLSNQNKR